MSKYEFWKSLRAVILYSSPTTTLSFQLVNDLIFSFYVKDTPHGSFFESIKPVQWRNQHHIVSMAEQLPKEL